ncbi:hypothetical protein BT69DRAFT_1127232 [Atractiella rhizophila]|nr:hypothetical protein BT69DRAFT_1127232 [Atractiella rhizophila]
MASETATSKRKHLSPNHSCAPCRQKKVRCSGTAPCDACVKYGVECVYEEGRGRRPGYFGTTKAKGMVGEGDGLGDGGEEDEEEETLEVLEERVSESFCIIRCPSLHSQTQNYLFLVEGSRE